MTKEIHFRTLERFGFGPNVMKKTKVCPKCGRIAKKSAFFCRGCGAFLSRETLYDRYRRQHRCCPDCDTVLTADSQYCPHCGKPLSSNEQTIFPRRVSS